MHTEDSDLGAYNAEFAGGIKLWITLPSDERKRLKQIIDDMFSAGGYTASSLEHKNLFLDPLFLVANGFRPYIILQVYIT